MPAKLNLNTFSLYEGRPLFSIITPTFRRPELLARNIKSLICQTFDNYEHIIVDDGNDPGTEKMAREFNDTRIKILKHDYQKGAAAAYNTGIMASKGEFIAFLDDDDEYCPQYLEKILDKFSCVPETIGFIWTGIMKVRSEGTTGDSGTPVLWPSSFDDIESSMMAASSIGNGFGVCLRRKCLETVGIFDEKLQVGSDTDFMLRLGKEHSCLTIPEPLVRIHVHGHSQLTDKGRNKERIKVMETILTRYKDIFSSFPSLAVVHLNAHAVLCYVTGLKQKGRSSFLQMIKARPLRIRTLLDFLSLEFSGKAFSDTITGKFIKRFI